MKEIKKVELELLKLDDFEELEMVEIRGGLMAAVEPTNKYACGTQVSCPNYSGNCVPGCGK